MLKVCCVYDAKAEMYRQLIVVNAAGEAIRSFSDEVNKEGSPVQAHPEDYTLFELGMYDDDKGILVGYEAKKPLGNGLDFVRKDI